MFPFDGPAGICHRPLTAPVLEQKEECEYLGVKLQKETTSTCLILHQYKELLSLANVFHQQKLIRRNTYDEVSIYPK